MTMANDRISMVVVGLRFGRYIVEEQLLKGPGREYVELVGVCDLDQTLASEMADRHHLRHYESLDAILADPSVEAVGLFTGPDGRADLIRSIIRAGKHVMTTKPLEVDAAAALAVLREARERNRAVHLNSPAPLPEPETQQIIEWTREFDLGRPISLHWETYADYFDEADGSWYDDPERCPVAPIFRLGIYGINKAVRLCGPVAQVNVVSSRIRTGRPTADNAMMSLLFRNGVVGSIHASFCVKSDYPYPDNLTLNYERGTVTTAPSAVNRFGTCGRKVLLKVLGEDGQVVVREASFGKEGLSGAYQWDAFHGAVRSGGVVPGEVTPEQIVASLQVIQAMAEAENTGRTISISECDYEL
jgi:predicted dehydrogenase